MLRTPLPDALMSDTIVVQHPGSAQWLSLRLAATIDIHSFLPQSLSAIFWDVVSSLKSAGEVDADNPLIASLARQGRDVIDTVLPYDPIDHEVFVEPLPATTLGRIQADLLDLIDRGAPGEAEAVPLPDLDSLQIRFLSRTAARGRGAARSVTASIYSLAAPAALRGAHYDSRHRALCAPYRGDFRHGRNAYSLWHRRSRSPCR